jgi:hypothetical protein
LYNNNNNNNDEIWGEKYITNFMVSYFNKKINFVHFMSTNDNNLLSHKYNKNKYVNIKIKKIIKSKLIALEKSTIG